MCVPCALKLLCLVLWLHLYIYSPPTMWCTMITSENLIRPHSFRTEFSTICTFNRKPEENSSQMWIMILGKSDGIDKLMKKWKYYYARAIRLHPDHMRATVHCVEWVFWIHCRRICILFLLIEAINIKKYTYKTMRTRAINSMHSRTISGLFRDWRWGKFTDRRHHIYFHIVLRFCFVFVWIDVSMKIISTRFILNFLLPCIAYTLAKWEIMISFPNKESSIPTGNNL